ncbi:hypothetical protein D1B17_11975 [Companilactobacillus zhachilii]|uniref:WxL domain-containing protein n=1 Tax=Companilactobacillus zhachilii TaxID=2304606 RepID=A0A386PTF7_9LACO|nr:hypothetical protein [Companilactobacillus zhachilii]AYE39304.1 hypothetical protein D1B17_11975 [Companilactobacillus zhachilii]
MSSADQDTISKAPTGLLMSNYFTIKNPTNNSSDSSFRFKSNSAFISNNNKVLVLAHGTSTNSADNTAAGSGWPFPIYPAVTDKTGSYGAAWSNLDTAYFKAGKPQTLSAWLSFGSGESSETVNGQGMALVLQNNQDGSTEMGAGQEGLGVYGYDKTTNKGLSTSLATPEAVAKTAVQNSIALEFDTQKQDSASAIYPPIMYSIDALYSYYSANTFDTKSISVPAPAGFPDDTVLGAAGSYGHIALTYPSDPATYYPLSIDNTSFYNSLDKGYSMFHIHRQQGADLSDSTDAEGNKVAWHHLTFRWMPSADLKTATISYSFNDRDPDGSINNRDNRIDDNITVDMAQLGNITSDSKIYWGFTGANNNINKNVASKLVSVESIPDLVNASIDTTVTDTTKNKVMFDDPDGGTGDTTDRKVASGDKMQLDYKLTYEDGREDWKNIAAKIILPKNITYDTADGNIGTIKYENGKTEPIPASALSTASDGLQTINYTFLQNLGNISATSKIADIIINGTAVNETDADIKVNDQPAIFTGSNNIESTSTPRFTVLYKKDWTLNLTNPMTDPVTLIYQQDDATLNLSTKLNYTGKTSPQFTANDPIHYQISVGNHNLTYNTTVSANSDTLSDVIPLRTVIEKAGLDFWSLFPNNETQKVTISAIDNDGVTSNTTTYNIQVEPNHLLELNADEALQFQSINYLSLKEYIHRANNYDVSVTSYRNPWMLQVSASELTNGDSKFNGVIVNKNASTTTILTNNPAIIASDNKSYDTETTTSISKLNKWTTDSGLLLRNYGLSSSKKYSGTLTWTIMDYDNSL